ncbi:MAG: hypothetical protein IT210_06715 [Armatimonadetes bacterium]|nr:hypothetical protein [Armatimonadota bacterium]
MASSNVSRRAVVIGLLLVPLNVYWVIVAELRWYVILTLNPLFITPVFYLFALALLNLLLRRFAPKLRLTPAEMTVIYIMLVLSCCIATHDFIINLMSSMGWARWFAAPENKWEAYMFPHLPRWLLVWDKELLKGYINGNSILYRWPVLKMWLVPLAFWSLFIFAIGWIMLCMNVILRKAWVDQTRLAFPIIRLPLALTEEDSPTSTLRSPALWLGFAFALTLGVFNGLHEWYPNVPYFQVRARWISFPTPPLSAIGGLALTYYPFAIGLAFLVPLDVSFSCWFFYLFIKAQAVIGYMLGYGDVPDFPFPSEQGIGAWYAFGAFLFYGQRHYLKQVFRLAMRPQPGADAGEPMSYRMAFWGLVAGVLVFAGFWWMTGMSLLWVFIMLATYLLVSVCITRVRAEAGGQHTVWDLEPKNLFRLFSSQALGPANLTAAAISHWYWRLNRSHVMPSQLEAFRLAQEYRIRLRSLVLPMMAAFIVATLAGMWACLHVFYTEGALAKCVGFAVWTGHESYDWLGNALTYGFRAEPGRWGAIGGAASLIVLLSWLRSRFAWFPFHPLGYCIGPGLVWLWLPFFIAWLVKYFILRYGGLRLYRKTLPLFLGLILGDYFTGAVWSLIGVLWHVPVYQTFH